MYLNDFFLHRNWTYLPCLDRGVELGDRAHAAAERRNRDVEDRARERADEHGRGAQRASARECSRIPSASPLLNAVTVTGKSCRVPPTPNGSAAVAVPVPTSESPQAALAASVVVLAICDWAQPGAAPGSNFMSLLREVDHRSARLRRHRRRVGRVRGGRLHEDRGPLELLLVGLRLLLAADLSRRSSGRRRGTERRRRDGDDSWRAHRPRSESALSASILLLYAYLSNECTETVLRASLVNTRPRQGLRSSERSSRTAGTVGSLSPRRRARTAFAPNRGRERAGNR